MFRRMASLGLALIGSALPAAGLDWQAGDGFRSAALLPPPQGKPGFTRLAPELTQIRFTNWLAQSRHLTNQILLNGSGVAAGDVDGDGWCDLYFCGLDAPNVLYRNLGNWKFEDVTASAGVACDGLDATAAAFADLDGDGDFDLVVNSVGGGTHIFFNDGKGHFTEAKPPLNPGKGGMSLALGDLDGDGFLDLYIANYRRSALMDLPNTRFDFRVVDGKRVVERVNGRPITDPEWANRFAVNARGGIDELGEPDALYLNRGGTNWLPVSFTGGAFLDEDGKPLSQPPFDWGLSVMIHDLNGDGLPDLYVCNDFDTPDRAWLNLGGGRFRALPRLALRKTSLFTMGVDFADINRDGYDDFILLDMLNRKRVNRLTTMADRKPPVYLAGEIENRPQYMQTMLCLNRGDGTFSEIGQLAGVASSDWAWTPIFLDVDLDGYEDLLIANGNERDARNMDVAAQLRARRTGRDLSAMEILQARTLFPNFHTPNLAFRNRGDLTFEETGKQWGFDYVGVSQGMALADLDNDGDLDVVINNLNNAAGIYRNDASAPRIAVRLKGRPPNTKGIGAKLRVFGGALPMQRQDIICGGRYLSSDDPMRVFATGSTTNEMSIEVTWRSGKRSLMRGATANRVYKVDEASAVPAPDPPVSRAAAQPWFQDVSLLLGHTHHDDPFDDFAPQPLLPNRLSALGPGVSWCDLNGDGWDDLLIASGKGGTLGAYLNDGKGGFKRLAGPPFAQPVTRDQTTVLGWPKAPGQIVLLAGSANYEDGLAVGSCVRQYNLAAKTVEDSLPGVESSTGPLALADLDGDGNLELFVGGRVVPGKYPQAAASAIFRPTDGRWGLDTENTRRLAGVGLVSGAVFSDIDGDADADLILACEWGPVRVFRNTRGRLTDATEELGLAKYLGWWNGVNTGDFDGDGRLDIVASNWGRNTKYEGYRGHPLLLFYGDLDGDGTEDVLEAHFDTELKQVVPERGLNVMANIFPFLREKWTTHQAYAMASLSELFGDRLSQTRQLQANWLESTVFLNRGSLFEPRPLPVEAQMAPAFAVCVADLDGDGNDDIFLSQNFFATQAETPRYDAGRGLWLRGDGRGNFQALSGQESGVKVYGEQRGAAVCDYDGDGRVDLVVTQTGTETKLYRNVGAKPGLRVRLRGPAGNPCGVGAVLRLVAGQQTGPAREIHAGSGYWSQDSAVQVMGARELPAQVHVRWPGGKTVTANLPPQAREVVIDETGGIKAP